jgi:exopolyphosphatase / guanosine-5'-triphosphate,3'-diphosphate pyrophosphatase
MVVKAGDERNPLGACALSQLTRPRCHRTLGAIRFQDISMTQPKDRDRPFRDAPNASPPALRRLAAIDLGSNSFHLLVAQCREEGGDHLQVVTRLSEKVQLAAGLDDKGRLDEATMQRALNCLARFGPLLTGIETGDLRVVGTHALRDARNSQAFLSHAEALLGSPIEILAGREEARLIHLGATRALADSRRRLIVDIGGGSTECIVGEGCTPLALASLPLGCITFTRRFFADGEISEVRFHQAEQAALSELARLHRPYRQLGWSDPAGTSGTVRAAAAVIAAAGDSAGGVITRQALQGVRDRLVACRHLDRVALPGLEASRSGIFPAGVAILCAIFEAFDLATMRYVDGALREGMLHDMLRRDRATTPTDPRQSPPPALP